MTNLLHEKSIPALLKLLWHNFTLYRKRHFCLLLLLMLISALLEVVSLGAILPFLGILTSPEMVFNHPLSLQVADLMGINSADQFLLPITIAFILAVLIAGTTRIFLVWCNTRFATVSGSELSVEVYSRILHQPYHIHVARNSSEMISTVTNKITGVVFGVMLPLFNLMSATVLLIAIILALLAINPLVASMSALIFSIIYGLIALMARRRLRRNSKRIVQEQTQRIKAIQEGLGGIRDVILDGTQSVYSNMYFQSDMPLRRTEGDNNFIGQSPRFAIETLGMVLIASLAYVLSLEEGGIIVVLPLLGAMAVGAQRLLPALQQFYNSWVSIVSSYDQLLDIMVILDEPKALVLEQAAPMVFKHSIQMSEVNFRYSKGSTLVLDRINLNIPKGSRVGFIGSTGSGKSTLLDIIMGLLLPVSGNIKVDGKNINNPVNGRSWQRSIAHVPQSVFLVDGSVAENIAFGVPSEMIDLDRVRHAARQAQIADFIESSSEGYHAYVGERGIRLSGGQRQRIGIARALYKQADVLILDEATSALDTKTEQGVISEIAGLSQNLTILLIAHRLTTLIGCDIVVELEKGRVVRQGSYENILGTNSSHRQQIQIRAIGNKTSESKKNE
jgi:ATP-binding cassette, subfamily B, bacterial PglK